MTPRVDAAVRSGPKSLESLVQMARSGRCGVSPAELRVTGCFLTVQGSRHAGRSCSYRNQVLSLRVGAAVGSCGVEAGPVEDWCSLTGDLTGATVHQLLDHPRPEVRVAALDAYLMHGHPHPQAGGFEGEQIPIAAGSSLDKSLARADRVVELLPIGPGQRVLVVGVVNSLLAALRARELEYIPCDRAAGTTEWGEPVLADAEGHLGRCDAVLATGMTLAGPTFDRLLHWARSTAQPLVMFAQSGSAVLPWFLGSGLHAFSAEPYPFFSLHGGPSVLIRYRQS